jgi:HPt (histidine-containing phosphotransfer) domain-containing protein
LQEGPPPVDLEPPAAGGPDQSRRVEGSLALTGLNAAGTTSLPGYDFSGLLELVGDDLDFLAEVVTLFELDSGRLLAEIRVATTGPGGDALERPAHALKGSLSYFGASEAIDLCRRLEAIGSGLEAGDARDLERDLSREIALLRHELARLAP